MGWVRIYVYWQTPNGCQCATITPAPAARYRISVPVYRTADDANRNQVGYTVTTDFQLPAPGGVWMCKWAGRISASFNDAAAPWTQRAMRRTASSSR